MSLLIAGYTPFSTVDYPGTPLRWFSPKVPCAAATARILPFNRWRPREGLRRGRVSLSGWKGVAGCWMLWCFRVGSRPLRRAW